MEFGDRPVPRSTQGRRGGDKRKRDDDERERKRRQEEDRERKAISSRRRRRPRWQDYVARRGATGPIPQNGWTVPEHLIDTGTFQEWSDVESRRLGDIWTFVPNGPAFRVRRGNREYLETLRFGLRGRQRGNTFSRPDLSQLIADLLINQYHDALTNSFVKLLARVRVYHRDRREMWISIPASNVSVIDQRESRRNPVSTIRIAQYVRFFQNTLAQKEAQALAQGSDDADNIGIYDRLSVIVITQAGGCSPHDKKNVVNSLITKDYKSSNNECLVTAICRVLEISNKSYTQSKNFIEYLRVYKGIRHEFGEMYDLSLVPHAAEFFRRNLRVVDSLGHVLLETEPEFDGELIELLLHDNHYSHIIKRYEQSYICSRCRRIIVKQHTCTAKRCTKCGVWYVWEHNICNESKIKFQRNRLTREMSKTRVIGKDIFEREYKAESNYVVFDLETFARVGQVHQVYAAGLFDCVADEYHSFYGPQCMSAFLQKLIKIGERNKKLKLGKLTVVGFNNTNFDNFFLIREQIEKEMEFVFRLKDQQLIIDECKWFKMLDVAKFLAPTSLAEAAKNFGAPEEWQKSHFPHKFIDCWDKINYVGRAPSKNFYFKPNELPKDWEFPEVWNFRSECLKYLRKDILATKFIYDTVAQTLFQAFNVNINRFITSTQLAYDIWTNTVAAQLPDQDGETGWVPDWIPSQKSPDTIYVPDEEQWKFMAKATRGGLAYPIKARFVSKDYDDAILGRIPYESISDYILPLDVGGLYPESMRAYDYPCGLPRWVLEGSDDLAAYQSSVDSQRPLDIPYGYFEAEINPNPTLIVPIYAQKDFTEDERNGDIWSNSGLNWNLLPCTAVATNIDIMRMIKSGYGIVLKKALVYPTHAKLFKSFIERAKAIKEKGIVDGNVSMRNLGKLLMNGLYGKLLEVPVMTEHKIIYKRNELDFFLAEHHWEDIVFLDNDNKTALLQGTKKNLRENLNKPYIGGMVLSWSRWIMDYYDEVQDPFAATDPWKSLERKWYYRDTDSMHIRISCPEDLEIWKPWLQDNKLGFMWYDLKGKQKVIKAFFIGPKCYCLQYVDTDGKVGIKIRARSLHGELLTMEDFEDTLYGIRIVKQPMEVMRKTAGREVSTDGGIVGPFSIIKRLIKRKMCQTRWAGRTWLPDYTSVPIGFQDLTSED